MASIVGTNPNHTPHTHYGCAECQSGFNSFSFKVLVTLGSVVLSPPLGAAFGVAFAAQAITQKTLENYTHEARKTIDKVSTIAINFFVPLITFFTTASIFGASVSSGIFPIGIAIFSLSLLDQINRIPVGQQASRVEDQPSA